MISNEKEASKRKSKKLDSKIINSLTPFSALSYDRTKEIEIFIGRESYIRILTETLFKSVYSNRSYGITISGPGGCGKSTLFGYLTQLIEKEEIFQKNYCRLKKDKSLIITCFIDAPKGEPTTLKYFWTSIIDSLAEENFEFLEKFAIRLFSKCLDVLWKNNFEREELSSYLSKIIPNFEVSIKHHRIFDLIEIKKFFDEITTNVDFSKKIYSIISRGWRILQKHEVYFEIFSKSSDLNQKRILKFEKKYFDLLYDNLSFDIERSTRAQNVFKGSEGSLIKSDSDVIDLFNWLTQTWEWIIEKPIVFLVGIDNIGYLTVNLDEIESAYIPFVQTILQMRESLKKFLFVLIGTNEDWRLLNDYINLHQDYRTQLQGFIINRIDLTRLTLNEVIEALTLIMTKFWSRAGIVNPSNPLYPFGKNIFAYLYGFYAHEYRAILNFLDMIWSYFKSFTKVFALVDPFSIIKFVRIKINKFSASQSSSSTIYPGELYYNDLIEWEKEQIKIWFENVKARHIGQKQSDMVERKVTEALRILQEKEVPKQISWAEKTPTIKIVLDSGSKTRYPDVYVKLSTLSISDKKKAFEIQVKMYDQNQFVKLKDIKSSLELLEHAYTDVLLFLMTGAGLENKAIEKIKELNLEDRILYSRTLDDEQFKALAFLVAYEEITGKKPSIKVIKELFEILFNQSWDSIIDEIRSIGSYRDMRIAEELKEKAKTTLIRFVEPTKQIFTSKPQKEEIQEKIQSAKIKIIDTHQDLELDRVGSDVKGHEEIFPDKIDEILENLNLREKKVILKKVRNRYRDFEKDLKFIIDTATKRNDRHKGKTTKDYLKKRIPPHLSDEEVNELFLRLKNECVKKQLPEDELLFTYKGTSIIITELGNDFLKVLNSTI